MSSHIQFLVTLFFLAAPYTVSAGLKQDIPIPACTANNTKPTCAKFIYNQLTSWDNTVLCLAQDGRLHFYQDGIIHSATGTFSLWATDFVDGKILDIIAFIKDSEFVIDSSVVEQSLTVYMDTFDGEKCQTPYAEVQVTYKDGTVNLFPVAPGGQYFEYSPTNPITLVKSLCGDSTAYVDLRFTGTVTLSRNVL